MHAERDAALVCRSPRVAKYRQNPGVDELALEKSVTTRPFSAMSLESRSRAPSRAATSCSPVNTHHGNPAAGHLELDVLRKIKHPRAITPHLFPNRQAQGEAPVQTVLRDGRWRNYVDGERGWLLGAFAVKVPSQDEDEKIGLAVGGPARRGCSG